MLISLRVGMMKPCLGQRWHCESGRINTPDCVSRLQAVRLLGVTMKLGDWRRDYSRLTRRPEFPACSRMYLALTGIQNTRRSIQMVCERRAYLNEADASAAALRAAFCLKRCVSTRNGLHPRRT